MVAAAVITLAAVGGWSWYRSWAGATPDLVSSCGGVFAADVQWREAASVREAVVAWHPGERLGLFLCPSGSETDDLVVRELGLGIEPWHASAIWPVGVEVATSDGAGFTGDVSGFEPFRPDARGRHLTLWFEFDWCWPDVGFSYDTVEVGYRFRGRDRTMRVPLGYVLTVQGPETCAEPAQQEEQVPSWVQALGETAGDAPGESGVDPYETLNVGRDLCRYLDGVGAVAETAVSGRFVPGATEPLGARAVYRIDDADLQVAIIDAALDLVCPPHATRRTELLELVTG